MRIFPDRGDTGEHCCVVCAAHCSGSTDSVVQQAPRPGEAAEALSRRTTLTYYQLDTAHHTLPSPEHQPRGSRTHPAYLPGMDYAALQSNAYSKESQIRSLLPEPPVDHCGPASVR